MSENLDLVRSIFAAWERGDFSSVEWADPEIEWVIAAGPTPGRWTGLPKIAEAWRGFLSTWEEARVVVDDYREFDDERVLVFLHYSGRGKTSGLEARANRVEGRVPVSLARRQGDEARPLLGP